ncbi:uncharacterized protein MONBRDRAFT_32353 [Monosiga brevicollis MX1]|uniref:CYRIA/CYRIB Rac1 binding domain-containing protein n=1 Tax=Monosiga brevicollis TaxID=81824 RepID=A9UZ01_MONBE|nr:uncharacterized protein MONBRDRAFT_32353 [Monosiga brevicollis MX1]EDQ89698.1 predicted protein [Monosiga brevicollis MX1]|eukprot:XP_001745727.1 hypothetical protein [Monosiga brevicollis MX1]
MTDLGGAIQNVMSLSQLRLPDDQPHIEAAAATINYEVDFDTNFQDREAFIAGIAKYVEEAQSLATLNQYLEEGERFAGMLYTWRSCSRSIPAVKSNDQANRTEIYEKTVEVLEPEINKLKSFYDFQREAMSRFCEEIKKLAHPEKLKSFISETTKLTLARMLNMFAVLNALKNVKACLNNDFSFYNRAHGFLNKGKDLNPEDVSQSHKMAFFLATQDSLTQELVQQLRAVDNYVDVLYEIALHCVTMYEKGQYVLPSEKHTLLKVIAFCAFLMDDPDEKASFYRTKKGSIHRFDMALKDLPVVPLYGDMHVKLISFFETSPHFDRSRWSAAYDANNLDHTEKQYNICDKLDGFEQERDSYLARLALFTTVTSKGDSVNSSGMSPTDIALQGLKLVSRWTGTIRELHVWKLANPTNQYLNKECPPDAEDYEKATRYNYTSREKTALVKIVAMIKDVLRHMWSLEGVLNEGIVRDIHLSVQMFLQDKVRDMIRHAIKKKKPRAKTVLMGMRNTCTDWSTGQEPQDDPYLKGEKDQNWKRPEVQARRVGLSSTQLYMFRTMLESLCADDKKKSVKSELDPKYYPGMQDMYERSFYFEYLLNFNATLQRSADLSQLWYREFYLELTQGARVQFPIEMSLPWILVDHVLRTPHANLMEYILFPLDLYNDAANFALEHFKKQFLYDEVEAEADLAFDQLVFKLNAHIFQHFKTVAAGMQLDKDFRNLAEQRKVSIPFAPPDRFSALLRQRHVQLLGRSVDLHKLLTQRLNVALRDAMTQAIQRFESQDLSAIIELEMTIENNRLTHQLLSHHLSLDPFDELYAEANDSATGLGKIRLHVFSELCLDVIPNYCYNTATRRFVRPVHAPVFADGVQRENHMSMPSASRFGNRAMNQAYSAMLELYKGYVGREHFSCAVRLLGYGGVAMCVGEMIDIVTRNIRDLLTPYVINLLDGMPKVAKLPLLDYGTQGTFGFYKLQLQGLMTYPDLQTEVFHSFREVGNAFIIFHLFEETLHLEEVQDLACAKPFQGKPPVIVREGENAEEKRRRVMQEASSMFYMEVIKRAGTPEQQQLALQADTLTRERLCMGLSMFQGVLDKVKAMLKACDEGQQVWFGPEPANGVMDIDECNQFHRLWSAILYTINMGSALAGKDQTTEFFGDGLYWSGAVLIALLGQQHRFEAFDFSNHIAKAFEMDQNDTPQDGITPSKFVANAERRRGLHQQVFSLLDKHLRSNKQQAKYFPPPAHEEFETSV